MIKYNLGDVGNRIKAERKRRKISQDGFIELLNQRGIFIGRNRLSEIENGKTDNFGLKEIIAFCDIFQCDIGFLLGEIEEKTRDKHFIHQQTGLTETAIDYLAPHSKDWQTGVLNLLLEEYPDFVRILAKIYEYYDYYATAESDKAKYTRESFKIRAETKGIDPNDWEKILEADNKRTITADKLERNSQLVKAQRLNIYESFISLVDKIVEKQYEKNTKKSK